MMEAACEFEKSLTNIEPNDGGHMCIRNVINHIKTAWYNNTED